MSPPDRGPAVVTTRAFVEGVAWGEHHKVWELLGIEGRATVLRVAAAKGMDEALAARLRDGTASSGEREEFLADLVNGLRADLEGTDYERLEYLLDPEPPEPGRARVVLMTPLPEVLGGSLPVATVELAEDGGTWQVERLVPRTTK
jgi:hypothetical protein